MVIAKAIKWPIFQVLRGIAWLLNKVADELETKKLPENGI